MNLAQKPVGHFYFDREVGFSKRVPVKSVEPVLKEAVMKESLRELLDSNI